MAPPAGDRRIRPYTAGIEVTDGHLLEGTGGRGGLAVFVVAPAGDGAVFFQGACVSPTGAHLGSDERVHAGGAVRAQSTSGHRVFKRTVSVWTEARYFGVSFTHKSHSVGFARNPRLQASGSLVESGKPEALLRRKTSGRAIDTLDPIDCHGEDLELCWLSTHALALLPGA
jgi:hypothetical protein